MDKCGNEKDLVPLTVHVERTYRNNLKSTLAKDEIHIKKFVLEAINEKLEREGRMTG